MFLITAANTINPNTAATVGYIVMALVLILTVFVAIAIIKMIIKKFKGSDPVASAAPAEAAVHVTDNSPAAIAPGSAGQIKLHDVDPKTAAMLMAIVANKTGKPLNELRFISIKEVK